MDTGQGIVIPMGKYSSDNPASDHQRLLELRDSLPRNWYFLFPFRHGRVDLERMNSRSYIARLEEFSVMPTFSEPCRRVAGEIVSLLERTFSDEFDGFYGMNTHSEEA